jgi:hypothetical protein
VSVSGVGGLSSVQSHGEEMAGSVSFAPCAVCVPAVARSPHFENFLIRKIIPIFPVSI